MNEFEKAVRLAVKRGFSVGLKFTDGNAAYTLFAPSGKTYGRGVVLEDMQWDMESVLSMLAASTEQSLDYIEKEFPNEMVPKKEPEEVFLK